jgi:transcriptional regulator with XRE-family HTH domain
MILSTPCIADKEGRTYSLNMKTENGLTLGEKIARYRKQRGWTQSELAERIFVHNRHVTRLERDKMKPSEATLAKLIEVFKIKPEDIMPDSSDSHLTEL